MEEDKKAIDSQEVDSGEEKLLNRRDFLDGLGKWSKIVIGAAVFGGALLSADEEAEARGAWANGGGRGGGGRGGGAWANGGGRGGGAWANGGGGGGGWPIVPEGAELGSMAAEEAPPGSIVAPPGQTTGFLDQSVLVPNR